MRRTERRRDVLNSMAATYDAFDERSMIPSFLYTGRGRLVIGGVGTHMYDISGRLVHCMALGVTRILGDGLDLDVDHYCMWS